MKKFALALHGGAGTILRQRMTSEKEKNYRDGLSEALTIGHDLLATGSDALDAVEAVVRSLENNPLYNAGKGAVYAADGQHYLDAAIMRGDTLEAGSVANVQGVKNPISLARKVMEETAYVMMSGEGASTFAREQGLEMMDATYFHDQFRYDQWQRIKDTRQTQLDHVDKGERNFGTVGAVALDVNGLLAAATSTGGMTNKRYGRVGDSPIIGSGTYADNRTCAISATGHGEPFIRSVVAHQVSMRMSLLGEPLWQAAEAVMAGDLTRLKGTGGMIAVDFRGEIYLPFNSKGMYRASWRGGEPPFVGIYQDEP
ncbi:MAG: isoaspartyl peptidase/L-asparaginase [Bacteroidota bacterium]